MRRSGAPPVMLVLSLLSLLATGCTDAADGEWTGSIDTLANGAVRVSNPGAGVWDAAGGGHLEPVLALGELEGPPATMFESISGLQVDAAGRIYVLERRANELRIFDADGTHVRTVGRSGGGPGEYSNANGLVWMADDTLVVIDQRGNRYSLLTRAGDFVRSVPRALGFFGWNADAAYHEGRVYENSSVRTDEGESRPALLGTALHDGAVNDTLLLPVTTAPRMEPFSHQTDRGGMVMGVPFAPAPVYHVAPDGTVWHGHGSEFRLVRTRLAGDTLREVLLAAQPVAVTADELSEWEESTGTKQFREMGGRIDMSRIPRTKPLFDGMFTDDEGRLWTSLPAPPGEAAFAVFDADGRFLGRLAATGVRRDAYVRPVVRGGRLHFVGRDELDVQRVYVFRISGS
jgi:hypothetical protein